MTTMTRTTTMTTSTQDRLEERESKRDVTTSIDGILRLLTDFRRYLSQKVPRKSSRRIPGNSKFTQQKSPTHICRGVG